MERMSEQERKSLFTLQSGEKIIEDIKPLPKLRWYFLIAGFIGIFLLFGIFGLFGIFFIIGIESLANFRSLGVIGFFFLVGLIALTVPLILGYIIASLKYKHQYYWITNKRVIFKQGLLGYSINSIPLERISDVNISRSFLENIFGFGSLHIQSLAGQGMIMPQQYRGGLIGLLATGGGGRFGAEASLMAVPNPEETQELIFKLIKKKRKEEKLTF